MRPVSGEKRERPLAVDIQISPLLARRMLRTTLLASPSFSEYWRISVPSGLTRKTPSPVPNHSVPSGSLPMV